MAKNKELLEFNGIIVDPTELLEVSPFIVRPKGLHINSKTEPRFCPLENENQAKQAAQALTRQLNEWKKNVIKDR